MLCGLAHTFNFVFLILWSDITVIIGVIAFSAPFLFPGLENEHTPQYKFSLLHLVFIYICFSPLMVGYDALTVYSILGKP